MQKPMLMTKTLQLIDKNFDKFRNWVCSTSISTAVCYCRNTNPVARYVCYIFRESSLSN